MKLAVCKCLLEATVPQKKKPGGEADGQPRGRAVGWSACLREVGLVDQAGGGSGSSHAGGTFLMACDLPLDSARKGCFRNLGRKLTQ